MEPDCCASANRDQLKWEPVMGHILKQTSYRVVDVLSNVFNRSYPMKLNKGDLPALTVLQQVSGYITGNSMGDCPFLEIAKAINTYDEIVVRKV